MPKIGVIYLITWIILSGEAYAQCCSAGNPYFYREQSNLSQKQLEIQAGYKYSTSDTYYTGSEKITINDIEKAWFNYLNLQFVYGLTPRLNLQTELGYFINKTEEYYKDDWPSKTGYGLGDASLTIRYLAYKNFVRKFTVIPSVGMKFPVGVFDQEVDHVKLPITLQPSSGSYRYLINIYLNKAFKNPKWNLGFYGSFEYAQLIDSENFYYKYGNLYLFSLIGSYKISSKANAGLELRNEKRDKAIRNDDQVVESSGYHLLYTIPHLSYTFAGNWSLSANAEFPVFRYYNGIQLGNKFAFSARLSYKINFNQSKAKDI